VLTGLSAVDIADKEAPDVLPWLKSRKSRKFMGKQDELAVVAAGRALTQAQLIGSDVLHEAGLYLAVGHIPFERAEIEAIAYHSLDAKGAFCMRKFATEGIEQVNPLLTFRCLPNMPAFHVSLNFDIRGPYRVAYPGVGQFYAMLEEAVCDLREGRVRHALVGGVADQNNFLVEFFFQRSAQRAELGRHDAAGFLCIELAETARARGATPIAALHKLTLRPVSNGDASLDETLCHAASLPRMLAASAHHKSGKHSGTGLDRTNVSSTWGPV
jgi:3-oxoacyl-(acyl-carrier-protein) synthase